MNPLTNMKNVIKLSEQELKTGYKTSWHDQYRGSAWIFVGGLPYDLSEGDIICVFSQYGEIVNINLVRDKKTGKQKGFCFLCYEDQRSTVLAVDNLNGIKLLGKTLRVDHVENYKPPKDNEDYDDITRKLHSEGCGPVLQLPERNIKREESRRPMKRERSPMSPPSLSQVKHERNESSSREKTKKDKKRKSRRHSTPSTSSSESN